jgi:hypothetical protein
MVVFSLLNGWRRAIVVGAEMD